MAIQLSKVNNMNTEERRELECDFIGTLKGVRTTLDGWPTVYESASKVDLWKAEYSSGVCRLTFEGETLTLSISEFGGCLLKELLERAGVDYETKN